MLKSEVNNLSKKKELPFPKLMISEINNVVILAQKRDPENENRIIGFALQHPSGVHHSIAWDASAFADFYGSVTLTQTAE